MKIPGVLSGWCPMTWSYRSLLGFWGRRGAVGASSGVFWGGGVFWDVFEKGWWLVLEF